MKEGEYQMKRSGYPDLVKGIAIALTVIGHNIQFGTGGGIIIKSYISTILYLRLFTVFICRYSCC